MSYAFQIVAVVVAPVLRGTAVPCHWEMVMKRAVLLVGLAFLAGCGKREGGAQPAKGATPDPAKGATLDPEVARKAELESASVDLLLELNRGSAMHKQVAYWVSQGLGEGVPPEMTAESEASRKRAKEMEKALDEKYGGTRPKLGKLNPKRYELYTHLTRQTEEAVEKRTEEAHQAVLDELAKHKTASRGEVIRKWATDARTKIAADLKRLEDEFRTEGH